MGLHESRRNFLQRLRVRHDPTGHEVGEAIKQHTISILNRDLSRRTALVVGIGAVAVAVPVADYVLSQALGLGSGGKPPVAPPGAPGAQDQDHTEQKAEHEREAIKQYILEGKANVAPRQDLQEAVGKNVEVVDTLFINEGIVTANPNLPLVSRAYPLEGDQRSELLFRSDYAIFPGTTVTWQREARIRMLMADGTQVYEGWAIRNPQVEKNTPVDELMYTRVKKVTISPSGERTIIIDIDDGSPKPA